MTRFARAKGSKAFNERKEEDPTPWLVMRQQLAEQLNKNDNDCENKSYFADNKTDVKPEEEKWIEFNEFKLKKPVLVKDTKRIMLEKLPKSGTENSNIQKTSEISNTASHQSLFKLKKSKSNDSKIKNMIPKANVLSKSIEKNKSKQNMSNKKHRTLQTNKKTIIIKENEGFRVNNLIKNKKNSEINAKSIKKELKVNKFKIVEETNKEQEQTRITSAEPFKLETSDTFKNSKNSTKTTSKYGTKDTLSLHIMNNRKEFKKESKILSNKNRRDNVQTIIANGREIDIVQFEAFWVKKEDASKLKDLRKKLRDQKMSNDKIKTIMKLERRKAEKALAREKTNVCYHCRKFGHKFSECPEINDSSMSKSGICFKCGSTEHTHFECKVTHSQNFRYAVCFVCNEQGHISRQCSLNPQGQYPKGGSCHLCGEVTHLRKDCPKAFEEKPSSLVTVEKLNNIGLEDVSEMKTNSNKQSLVRNKVVQF